MEVERNRLDPFGGRTDRPRRTSVLTRAVGVADAVEVDLSEAPLMPGDVLLLCSDGLTREVTPDAILETVIDRKTPQPIAEQLMSLAKAAGGRDNITVLILSVHAGTAPTVWDRIRQRVRSHTISMKVSKENSHA
jgi:serine/threonine protein phosphatase PrpC